MSAPTVGLDADTRALADSVRGLAARVAPLAATRESLDDYGRGESGRPFAALVDAGLHRIHLPERFGGDGAGLTEAAVVVEQLAHALVPGPLAHSITASAAVAACPVSPAADALLASFAAGATGVLLTDHRFEVRFDDRGAVVTGVSEAFTGVPGAHHVLVTASDGDRDHLVPLSPATEGVRIEAIDGTDLTVGTGIVHADEVRVPIRDLVVADRGAVELVRSTLAAAQAAGVAQWCLSATVDYIDTRKQFGRAVGSFQAVAHKAAMLLVDTELLRTAAGAGAGAADESAEQQRLAALSAGHAVAALAAEIPMEATLLHGAIGFTWEYDLHLYWRKAIAIAADLGPTDGWARRLGEAARRAERSHRLAGPDDESALRASLAGPLDAARAALTAGDHDRVRRILADAGVVAPHYPPPFGLAATPRQQDAIAQELSARGIAAPDLVIGEWILPTIIDYGSEAQRDRFLPPSLLGRLVWCQLFSEPEAGSDLASLRTTATKADGGWVLRGQKVWTSNAHLADWGACLARSDASAAKHEGISYFLVDLRSPGVRIRPLRQATGRAEFNEVFLDEVFVPDDCLVGAPGQGWTLATATLGYERTAMGRSMGHGSAAALRAAVEDGSVPAAEPVIAALGRLAGRELLLAGLGMRTALGDATGADMRAGASVRKVYGAIAQRDGSLDTLAVVGRHANVAAAGYAIDHLGLPAVLTGGGTIEIQLNVIARRLLRLPGK
ncbi:acyl-CoA dehydrogenase [Gordonia neofelifaecis]|uniref:Acyl-CoA dehydrogenase n=1 Tax=Gordonia neofelifaecis NRRL B-59395 TaxID=644548 RepID=F1YNU9_9ACTN|nr:acyl-CoA dehydrogenase [Gordonia neofelifaecis]EGD53568.1 hypothetical protein SCNU_17992 [Gordonia neofelifaecis NRRL B-59395]